MNTTEHKSQKAPAQVVENGGPGQSRTADQRFRKPLLYPSELQGQLNSFNYRMKKCPSIATQGWARCRPYLLRMCLIVDIVGHVGNPANPAQPSSAVLVEFCSAIRHSHYGLRIDVPSSTRSIATLNQPNQSPNRA